MRLHFIILVAIPLAVSGCAVTTERSSLGYGDYVALDCDQLGDQALLLMRDISDRSEHILQNDEERREKAKQQLALVKRVSAEKKCP